ncbi:hypothetical protein cyc_08032 [Cyclospora cayetanensis]|uniref:Uncharacterized protein n=1 Tax=Cyclospora cayetanensis TaxID=88456 RepID=A0A1D3D2L1_9EIME|nr:hypothetical protein cyc_08032 [Cyclospora cayetanensis]
MRIRFSCVAFVPPDAQLGVVGSPNFLGRWDPCRCLPLLPYSSVPESGTEPSLWFADVEVSDEAVQRCGGPSGGPSDACNDSQPHKASSETRDQFSDRLIAAVTRTNGHPARNKGSGSRGASSYVAGDEASSLAAAAAYRVNLSAPEIAAVMDQHPFKQLNFEYKFIVWNLNKRVTPYVPDTPGEAFQWCAYGSPSCTWSTWLFPPPPANCTEPPRQGLSVVWEGYGSSSNRKFVFDPMDVVLDKCETGKLVSLYLCKIARFEDPRVRGSSEYDHTTRFYNTIKAEARMHYSNILPNLYVGSCPRQLQHIRHLKEDLKITAIFNLQTANDIRQAKQAPQTCSSVSAFEDPTASTRTLEAVGHLYESAGLRYVWMPTEDMSDTCRKLVVAQCALVLEALLKNGHTVYVHCNAGVGRSVAAVSAYLCFSVGLDVRKVNFLVNAKRPVAYWDEEAIKCGETDFQVKFGRGYQLVHDM